MVISTGKRPRTEPRVTGLGEDDAERILEVDRWAFPMPDVSTNEPAAGKEALSCFEWDRTRGAFLPDLDGEEQLAGINTVYTAELAIPGGSVDCAALTWVGVHPAFRRQGVLTAMIRDHLQLVHERGEPVSALLASEATIYGRFGFGIAGPHLRGNVPRGAELRPVPGSEDVRIRLELVDAERHADVVGDCYEAAARTRPGSVSRTSPAQRRSRLSDPSWARSGDELLRIFIAEADDDGPIRGYALFRRTHAWNDGRPAGAVKIREFLARDPAAARALWGRLLDLDLTVTVELDQRPTDDPLLHLLVDPRQARVTQVDGLWVRLVDLPVALAARRYAADLDVVIEVRDELCPWNAGRWRLTGGTDRAHCTPSIDPAAFRLDVRDLGAAYLGSVSLTALAGAGLITVSDPAGFAEAARAFGWPVAAYCGWGF